MNLPFFKFNILSRKETKKNIRDFIQELNDKATQAAQEAAQATQEETEKLIQQQEAAEAAEAKAAAEEARSDEEAAAADADAAAADADAADPQQWYPDNYPPKQWDDWASAAAKAAAEKKAAEEKAVADAKAAEEKAAAEKKAADKRAEDAHGPPSASEKRVQITKDSLIFKKAKLKFLKKERLIYKEKSVTSGDVTNFIKDDIFNLEYDYINNFLNHENKTPNMLEILKKIDITKKKNIENKKDEDIKTLEAELKNKNRIKSFFSSSSKELKYIDIDIYNYLQGKDLFVLMNKILFRLTYSLKTNLDNCTSDNQDTIEKIKTLYEKIENYKKLWIEQKKKSYRYKNLDKLISIDNTIYDWMKKNINDDISQLEPDPGKPPPPPPSPEEEARAEEEAYEQLLDEATRAARVAAEEEATRAGREAAARGRWQRGVKASDAAVAKARAAAAAPLLAPVAEEEEGEAEEEAARVAAEEAEKKAREFAQ